MKQKTREEFEAIANVAIEDAAALMTKPAILAEGLEAIIEKLQERLEEVEDEIRTEEEDEEEDQEDGDEY